MKLVRNSLMILVSSLAAVTAFAEDTPVTAPVTAPAVEGAAGAVDAAGTKATETGAAVKDTATTKTAEVKDAATNKMADGKKAHGKMKHKAKKMTEGTGH